MFAIPFGRIFWKEYRTQRTLWLCCVMIGLLFQIAVSTSLIDSDTKPLILLSVPAIFTIMYAVGCGAILFASEREDRTCEWLLSLSAPPAPTLSAKIGFAVSSLVILQLPLAFVSLVLTSGRPDQDDFDVMTLFFPFGLLVLIWSTLGSILSRRVLVALAVMVVCWAATFMIPMIAIQKTSPFALGSHAASNEPSSNFLPIVLCVTVLGADVWFGWRWCQGKYLDVRLFEYLQSRRDRWRNGLTTHLTSRTRIPTRDEYEQSWRRTWQRMVWQERHRESLQTFILIGGCVIGAILTLADRGGTFGWTYVTWPLILSIPMAMGVLGFVSNSSHQQFRFIANRGISPGSLWLAKNVVWLPGAFWVTGVVLFVTSLFELLLFPQGVPTFVPSVWRGITYIDEHPDLAIWFVLLSYCCGQTACLLTRRTILAVVIGVVFTCLAALWLFATFALTLPSWWALGLPVAAMLTISVWQMKPRLLEDHSWRNRGKLISVLLTIPMILVLLLANHRISEISTLIGIDQNTWNQINSKLAAAQLAPRELTSEENTVRRRIEEMAQSNRGDADNDAADEIVELMKRDLSSLEPVRPASPSFVSTVLSKRADGFLKAGELGKAIDFYLAELKAARLMLNRGDVYGWLLGGTSYQTAAMEELVNWANHPSQTPASIRNGIKSIDAELKQFPSLTECFIATYVKDRKRLGMSSSSQVLDESDVDDRGPTAYELGIVRWILPWEYSRLDLLMTRDMELKFAAISMLEKQIASPMDSGARDITQEISSMDVPAQLVNTTPFYRPFYVPISYCRRIILDRQTAIRAALTRMELIAYRLEHGKLPHRLADLLPSIDVVKLVDPWSGRLFIYYPTFLLSAGNQGLDLLPISATEVAFTCNHCRLTDAKFNLPQLEDSLNNWDIDQVNYWNSKVSGLTNSLFPIRSWAQSARQPKD